MAPPITTVAATVGTSLLGNLRAVRKASSFEAWLETQPESDLDVLRDNRNAITSASAAAEAQRWEDVGIELAGIPGTPRVLGAELSSLLSLAQGGRYASLQTYHLVHSDSPEGKGCAEGVRAYLTTKHSALWCQLERVPDLFHQDEASFRISGLRGLAAALAKILRQTGPGTMVIDATGGYKAQIAVAVVFGQAFQVPVVYRFEAFRHVIEMPALPLTLDLSVVADNLDLLTEDNIPAEDLKARFGGKPLGENNKEFAKFRACLGDPVHIDGVDLYPVSAFGQILLDRWRLEPGPAEFSLTPSDKQIEPRWGDHHRPAGIESWAKKLMQDFPWISRIIPRNAAGRTHGNGVFFHLSEAGDSKTPDIECRYVVDNHPAVLRIQTTATSRRTQETALRILEKESRAI